MQKRGKQQSPEHRENNAKARRGGTLSAKTRAKMSAARTGKKLPPFSEEHLKRMSEARRKRIISDETRRKTSETFRNNGSHVGWNLSEEARTRQKSAVKEALTGKPKSMVVCPYCNKTGGKPAMMRFHFDNCKEKKCA